MKYGAFCEGVTEADALVTVGDAEVEGEGLGDVVGVMLGVTDGVKVSEEDPSTRLHTQSLSAEQPPDWIVVSGL